MVYLSQEPGLILRQLNISYARLRELLRLRSWFGVSTVQAAHDFPDFYKREGRSCVSRILAMQNFMEGWFCVS